MEFLLFTLIVSFSLFKHQQVHQLIHESNGKINEFLLKYASSPMTDSEIYNLICNQHQQLQHQLHELLASWS
jgi:hypothetical protein